MDDTEGPQARATRKFGEELARAAGVPVHYWDERLSSFAADELLASTDLSRAKRKAIQDSLAAQVILQAYLDAHPDRGGAASAGEGE
jgi:putative Holliday junction resolvase